MKVELRQNLTVEALPAYGQYIAQDNFELVDLSIPLRKYLYCDSATSCIVVVVYGLLRNGRSNAVAISHLSRPLRFQEFFQIVEKHFKEISVFAHGANPPEPGVKKDHTPDYTALRNLGIVTDWVSAHSAAKEKNKDGLTIKQATLIFGEGNPAVYNSNLDCYGVDISSNKVVVSNRRFKLTMEDRDPSGGLQTLYCPFGIGIGNELVLIEASAAQIILERYKDKLVNAAHAADYEKYESMKDEDILKNCSSTPHAEVPWFCETIRNAAKYVRINYKSINQ